MSHIQQVTVTVAYIRVHQLSCNSSITGKGPALICLIRSAQVCGCLRHSTNICQQTFYLFFFLLGCLPRKSSNPKVWVCSCIMVKGQAASLLKWTCISRSVAANMNLYKQECSCWLHWLTLNPFTQLHLNTAGSDCISTLQASFRVLVNGTWRLVYCVARLRLYFKFFWAHKASSP